MSEPANLPMQPLPEHPVWQRFSSDPRKAGTLRASDADRDVARNVIAEAYADGRLDDQEMRQRSEQAMAVRELQQFPLLLGDLIPTQSYAASPDRRQIRPSERQRRTAMPAGVGLILMLNAIWLITCITTGQFIYYWPIWPMLGLGCLMFFGSRGHKG